MKANRIALPDRRELVVDRAHGLTIMWIWDAGNDRCSSGPFAVGDEELAVLRRVLAALQEEANAVITDRQIVGWR
jgi:hypothetical protein